MPGSFSPQPRLFERRAIMAIQPNNNPSRDEALRILLALAEADPTVSGVTLVLPTGEVEYLGASLLRTGGRA
jgi:hypothetical protein